MPQLPKCLGENCGGRAAGALHALARAEQSSARPLLAGLRPAKSRRTPIKLDRNQRESNGINERKEKSLLADTKKAFQIGAGDQIRTDYLVITNDVLYLLSYTSKPSPAGRSGSRETVDYYIESAG